MINKFVDSLRKIVQLVVLASWINDLIGLFSTKPQTHFIIATTLCPLKYSRNFHLIITGHRCYDANSVELLDHCLFVCDPLRYT